jgi:hypothetical protein
VASASLAATNAIDAVMQTYEHDTDGDDATFAEAAASQQFNLATLAAQAQSAYATSSAADYQSEIDGASISNNPFATEDSAFAAAIVAEADSIAGAAEIDALTQATLTNAQAQASATAQQSFSDGQADQAITSDEAAAQQAFDQAMAQVGIDRGNAADGGYQPLLPQLPAATNSVGWVGTYNLPGYGGLNGYFQTHGYAYSDAVDPYGYGNEFGWNEVYCHSALQNGPANRRFKTSRDG